jgi:hypothetical protein
MATLRVPEVVPSPTQDCEKLRDAVQGLSFFSFCYIYIYIYIYICMYVSAFLGLPACL